MSTTYQLSKRRSRFTVQVQAGGVLAGFGHNPMVAVRDFSGALDFDKESPEDNSFAMTVQAQSLEVTDDIKKQDKQEIQSKMRDDVLEVAEYPEINFKSTAITAEESSHGTYRLMITGDLSLHGRTRQPTIEAAAKVRDDEVSLSGAFTLTHSDYDLKRVSALGGALKVTEELQITFELKGYQG